MDEELGFPFDLEYLDNQSLFLDLDEGAPEEVVVWVESRDDIRLWKHVLKDNASYTFDFRPASMFRSADGKAANGCNRLIKLYRSGQIQAGKNSIFCLDSDFKYVASFADNYSGDDYNIPNFYWTRVHSKEQVFVFDDLVDEVVSQVVCMPKTKLEQRARAVYREISKAIYMPFIRLLYLRACSFEVFCADVQGFSIRLDSALKILLNKPRDKFDLDGCPVWNEFLAQVSNLDEDMSKFLESKCPNGGMADFLEALDGIGVDSTNVYLFYRGHDWYAVARHLAKSYSDYCNEIRLSEIKITSPDVKRDVQEHRNQTPNIKDALLSAIPIVEDVPFFKDTVELLRQEYSEAR
ncbi:DUF4435 domain-containing protein [Pseudomonas putida]|uniref:DUF4435 domain-containing protein n=1 Tax=Pseudomonas putida TaxID=303 RepID=UPI003F88888F